MADVILKNLLVMEEHVRNWALKIHASIKYRLTSCNGKCLVMRNPRVFDRLFFFGHNMSNNIAIKQAIIDLKTQIKRNYYATTKKYKINY